MPDMDDKRAIAAKAPSHAENQFPPFSLCGSVPLRHIHKKVAPATADLSANPLLAVAPPLLVYDGSCGFCSRAVQFILRHERRHDLLFVPRDSTLGKDLRRTYHLEAVESLLWIADGQAAIESSAVLNAAKYLGGVWSPLATLGSLCPAALRNWGYRLIARNRRRFSSGAATCFVPTSDQRTRFLN
jgi:predicted DCC family thiol-disulfide oxidoreductase YuxK